MIAEKRHIVTENFPATSRIPSNTNATTVGSLFIIAFFVHKRCKYEQRYKYSYK